MQVAVPPGTRPDAPTPSADTAMHTASKAPRASTQVRKASGVAGASRSPMRPATSTRTRTTGRRAAPFPASTTAAAAAKPPPVQVAKKSKEAARPSTGTKKTASTATKGLATRQSVSATPYRPLPPPSSSPAKRGHKPSRTATAAVSTGKTAPQASGEKGLRNPIGKTGTGTEKKSGRPSLSPDALAAVVAADAAGEQDDPPSKRNVFTVTGAVYDEGKEEPGQGPQAGHSSGGLSTSGVRRGSISGSQLLHPSAGRVRRSSRAGSSVSGLATSPSRRATTPLVLRNGNEIFDLGSQKDSGKSSSSTPTAKKVLRKKKSKRASQSGFGDNLYDNNGSLFSADDDAEEDGLGYRQSTGGARSFMQQAEGPLNEGNDRSDQDGWLSPAVQLAPRAAMLPTTLSRFEAVVERRDGARTLEAQEDDDEEAPMPRANPTPALASHSQTETASQPPSAPQPPIGSLRSEAVSDNVDTPDEDQVSFNPPLYIQRALLCIDTMKKHRCFNFIDAGCSDGTLLQYVVKSQLIENSFRNVVGIDLSKNSLNQTEAALPFPVSSRAEYLHRVRVELVLGDLTLAPPVTTGSLPNEDSSVDLYSGKVAKQRRPWLQMDRHYIRQQQQQQRRSANGGRESTGDISYNDLSTTFDESPAGASHSCNIIGSNNRSSLTLEEDGGVLPLQPMDAVLSIEVLEHIPPHLVSAYTDTVFAQLAGNRGARVVVLTTPNRAENSRFDKDKGKGETKANTVGVRSIYNAATGEPRRRHPEHLFELTPDQFKAYCEYIIAFYAPYWETYELVGLGDNFTQGAIFLSAAARQAQERRQMPRPHPAATSATPSAILSTSAYQQGTVGSCAAAAAAFVPARMPMSAQVQADSLGRWDTEDNNAAEDEKAPQTAREAAVRHTIDALQKGRHVETSLRQRVAHKAAAARRQSIGGDRTLNDTDGPSPRRKSTGPASPKRTGAQATRRANSGPTSGKRAVTARQRASPTSPPSTAPHQSPAGAVMRDEVNPATSDLTESPKRLTGYTAVHNADDGRTQTELEFEATLAGAVGLSVGRGFGANACYFTRRERLEGFPFESVFGMSEAAYREEFKEQIASVDESREARLAGTDPYFAPISSAGDSAFLCVGAEEGPDSDPKPRSRASLSAQDPLRRPSVTSHEANHGYVSMYRAVLPATSLWDRLCDAVFHCARNLYRDLLSSCYVSRRGNTSGGGGWRAAPNGGMLTREGLLFGELVLQRERTTAFQPLRCTVCAVLAMLEKQRLLWYKNYLEDLRRWYGFACVRRIRPNSAFTMLTGLINEVMPVVKHVSYSASASWANAVPPDSVVIPSSAAYIAIKARPPADQKEGYKILKDLRLSQSGLRVHTWLLEEITRLALAHRRRLSAANAAPGAKPEAVTAEDVAEDDRLRLDAFLPDDVALVLLFMAAVDALPKASAWLKERVPRWNPAGAGLASEEVAFNSLGDADFDPAASVSRRRRLQRQQEERARRGSSSRRASSGGAAVEVAPSAVGHYSASGSSGLADTQPSSSAALLLAAGLSTFRVDTVVLEHLLGPPEDHIVAEY